MQIQKQLQSEHRDAASSASRTTVERLLADIRELAPAISARAAEIEAGRRMPLALVEALKAIGVFRIFVPRSHGGLELDLPAALEIIEALGQNRRFGRLAAMISGRCDLFASLLSPESYEQVYRKGPDVIIAGSAQPAGTADAAAGGWRVNGRWPFASGCQHADWIFGFCIMTEDGKPLASEDGTPLVRGFLLPARDWRIEDTWHVAGLKETGSHHIALSDTLVPAASFFDLATGVPCLPGPLYQAVPQFLPLLHATLDVGVAEGRSGRPHRAGRDRPAAAQGRRIDAGVGDISIRARTGRGRSAGRARVSPGPGREPLAPCARRNAEGRGAAHAGHASRDLGRHHMRRRRRCMLHAGRRQRDL